MYFIDTETCGLHGLAVLLQYAENDGPVVVHDIWNRRVSETLALIEKIADNDVVGFNLAFDWFHLCKIYTIWKLLPPDWIPADYTHEIALKEPEGRFGLCLKPKSALDLMLHARKGQFQSLMARDDIRIRRVPSLLAYQLADELGKRVPLDDIYFAKRKDQTAPQWQVYDIKKGNEINPDFKDVVLRFAASGALKTLAQYCGLVESEGTKGIIKYHEIEVPRKWWPTERGYAPCALLLAPNYKETGWYYRGERLWPEVILMHISHWRNNVKAREYASNDIIYTRGLYNYFKRPPLGDDDSVLACMVGAVRWRGYKVDLEAIKTLRTRAVMLAATVPTSPAAVREYICETMDTTEQVALAASTKRTVLEAIERWMIDCKCAGEGQCATCHGKGEIKHPAAIRATEVLDARKSLKEIEIYDKILLAGRFHASFVVIGTLSSRMAGSDGLNPQGIKHTKDVRAAFTLADNGFNLCGGDFKSFEVSIADAEFNDPTLRSELLNGKKIHALFGMELFPGTTYEEILKSEGTSDDKYDKGKKGIFAMIYGGDENTLVTRLGIILEAAQAAYARFIRRHPMIGVARKAVFDAFCSMRQPNGIGSKVEWTDPAPYVESFLGFKRFFTIENRICKTLFELAQNVPPTWRALKLKVQRRDRIQTAGGAAQSALYGAAFGIQAGNMRAALNHKIQSPGATITKAIQRTVWNIQPHGAHDWVVIPMNVHDEIMCPTKVGHEKEVEQRVQERVKSFTPKVPLLRIDWWSGLDSWADKKGKGP